MKISKLANGIKPSKGRQLFNLAAQYDDVINLTLGDPDIIPPECIRQAGCDAIMEGKTRYSANAGLVELTHLRLTPNPHEIRLFSGCPYYFTLPMDGNYNSFTEHLRQPCKERRSFGVDVHHIVFSKCTIKCRKCGGADCSKSP